MDKVHELAAYLAEQVKIAKNGGIAKAAVAVSENQVLVDGQFMTAEVIVPINVLPGQRVIVQVSAGDNKAYIIG